MPHVADDGFKTLLEIMRMTLKYLEEQSEGRAIFSTEILIGAGSIYWSHLGHKQAIASSI
jgi:hypothetical protein